MTTVERHERLKKTYGKVFINWMDEKIIHNPTGRVSLFQFVTDNKIANEVMDEFEKELR